MRLGEVQSKQAVGELDSFPTGVYTMKFTESDLEAIIGTKSYRNNAIKESLNTGRAAYGPVDLFVETEASMMEVRGPFFDTVLDLRELTQTENGVSIKAVREEIDDVISSQVEEYIAEQFW